MSFSMSNNRLMYKTTNGITGGNEKDENINNISVDEVLPGLWIGNQAASQSKSWLKNNNIKTIFNCTKHLPFVGGAVQIRIPVNDPGPFNGLEQDDVKVMSNALPCAVDMLHYSLGKGGVLVHCHAGMQRSAAVITAYLAKYYFFKLDNTNIINVGELFNKSRTFLHKKRSKVFYQNWYVNFEKAIKEYIKNGMPDAELGKCGL